MNGLKNKGDVKNELMNKTLTIIGNYVIWKWEGCIIEYSLARIIGN